MKKNEKSFWFNLMGVCFYTVVITFFVTTKIDFLWILINLVIMIWCAIDVGRCMNEMKATSNLVRR